MEVEGDDDALTIPPALLAEVRAADELTDEYRQVLREKIAQGVTSLREGRVTDGEAFMARMDSELAELERQGP